MKKEISVLPEGAPRCQVIKTALRSRGITQEEVAEKRGVHKIHVSKVLNGNRESDVLLDFCETLIRNHDATQAT